MHRMKLYLYVARGGWEGAGRGGGEGWGEGEAHLNPCTMIFGSMLWVAFCIGSMSESHARPEPEPKYVRSPQPTDTITIGTEQSITW